MWGASSRERIDLTKLDAFAGLVAYDGKPIDRRIEDRLCRALVGGADVRLAVSRADHALFAEQLPTTSRQGLKAANCRRAGVLFAGSIRLDNRSELGHVIQLSPSECASVPDSELLVRMLERWGDEGVARCLGAFAFAHWEPTSRRLTLGRDCFGQRTLFFHRGPGFVAFASTLNTLLALPDVPRELDEIVLANYLALNLTEPRRTFYRGIDRVPSRTLVVHEPDSVSRRHYWTPRLDAPPPYRRDQDYIERARELLDQAVADATAGVARIAIATSGGLDSSAIAATVARRGSPEQIDCYSLVAADGTDIDIGPLNYLDERPKLRALGQMYPSLNLRFLVPLDPQQIEEDHTRYFANVALPILNPAIGGKINYFGDAVDAAGCRRVLTGVYGNFGLTWSGELSLLALLVDRNWRMFARELSALARRTRRSLMRTFAKEVILPGAPPLTRRLIYRLLGRDPDSVAYYSALNPEFIDDHRLTQSWRAEDFDPWFTLSTSNPAQLRAHYLFDFNQFGRDGRALATDRRSYEMRHPYADRRLAEFTLQVPEPMFRRNGVNRSFARAVFADRLPREILDERRRGANDPNWFRRAAPRRDTVTDNIARLEGSPIARKLIDLPRLKRLAQEWPADEQAAQKQRYDYQLALPRAIHVGNFIRWVEGGNS